MGSVICLDVGTKRIGVAASDMMRVVSSPVSIIYREKFADVVETVKKIIEQYSSVAIIVGYPYEMDGTEGISCQRVRHFCHNLFKALQKENRNTSFLLWDERLSSQEAEEAMLEADLSRKNRLSRRDKIAASLILQGFLAYSTLVS